MYQQQIERRIAEAREVFKQAQSRATRQEERMMLCREALRICADYKDARDLLNTMPPTPPKNLQVRMGQSIVSLTWELSSTQGVSYIVICKPHSQPASVKDGSLLGTLIGRVYDDTAPKVGLPLYYAVFAECEGVVSTQCATLQEPIFLTRDIEHETVKISDQQIELSWQNPPNVHAMIVVRKEQSPPLSINDGEKLPVTQPARLIDRDVQNEHTYYYSIYCQFKNHLGQLVTTDGKIIQATPETPPGPIRQIDIAHTRTPQGYRVELRWAAPAKGRVVILKSERQLSLKVGEVIQPAQLRSYGQMLEGLPDTLTDAWTRPGVGYYTPIVIFGDMAYIGKECSYACINDVSDVQYENLGAALRLQWTWPQGCQEVTVSYSCDGWPGSDSIQNIRRDVTRAEYDSLGHFDIREAANRDYYIVVSAIVRQDNQRITGLGCRVHARLASKVVVTYEIKQTGFLGRGKRVLHIRTRQPGMLPTLVMVSSRGRLPLYRAEGELFYRLEGPLAINDEVTLELPTKSFPPKTFGKLYLEEDSEYEVVTIYHPNEDKLRLG
jgi:hypothetical protein